ncbi:MULTISPECIES: carbon-nitrogen hydrolase family protein [Sinorhizobium]|uniref:Carbon-nitrogen hydrolase n=1 Tax=Sinorhizobium americanum TaxID=194963 RepID=A0A2S3YQP1_9HYPH|nr:MULTISPECIES: carbon-nitrogen hydrolase family protein [Sinorhizobium]PDT34702.1 carbon-nitrogen hydrolase [Sinorhizobium sp. FG01]PDT49499.1 carbon-nitrogen hydrolase [Sinorhizobium sp. NG07B]POH33334.1 carbon-nitrogen hydrolase [Sinorhizobium americanum]POH33508.1 carbon-nitrogen hydrolase [Sinorhizobium americanum]
MKVSLIQTNPQQNRQDNLRVTRELMLAAVKADKPDLIVLPEYFAWYGKNIEAKLAMAEPTTGGPAYRMASDFAREHGVYVHAGTILEKVDGENRVFNTSFVFDRNGKEVAAYRKIHLFDIVAPDGTEHKESATVKPGEDVVTYEIDGLKIGCAICFDIRFFELFLQLEKAGCDIIVLPAAFTLQTGKDHWEVLARARSIETQTYFVACGQTGAVIEGSEKHFFYGHSLVCDPWGHTIARASDGVGFVTARIDAAQIKRVRGLIPMTQHRRLACA